MYDSRKIPQPALPTDHRFDVQKRHMTVGPMPAEKADSKKGTSSSPIGLRLPSKSTPAESSLESRPAEPQKTLQVLRQLQGRWQSLTEKGDSNSLQREQAYFQATAANKDEFSFGQLQKLRQLSQGKLSDRIINQEVKPDQPKVEPKVVLQKLEKTIERVESQTAPTSKSLVSESKPKDGQTKTQQARLLRAGTKFDTAQPKVTGKLETAATPTTSNSKARGEVVQSVPAAKATTDEKVPTERKLVVHDQLRTTIRVDNAPPKPASKVTDRQTNSGKGERAPSLTATSQKPSVAAAPQLNVARTVGSPIMTASSGPAAKPAENPPGKNPAPPRNGPTLSSTDPVRTPINKPVVQGQQPTVPAGKPDGKPAATPTPFVVQ